MTGSDLDKTRADLVGKDSGGVGGTAARVGEIEDDGEAVVIEWDADDDSDKATWMRSRRPEIWVVLDRAVVGCRQQKEKGVGDWR